MKTGPAGPTMSGTGDGGIDGVLVAVIVSMLALIHGANHPLAGFDADLRGRGITLWMVDEIDDAVAAFADPRTSPPPSA
jgi:hypothetical protein